MSLPTPTPPHPSRSRDVHGPHRPGGYRDFLYANALSEIGAPRQLPRSGAWFLVRRIPGTDQDDAVGCYPLFCCNDWEGLESDLDGLGDELVSFCAVTDPFCGQSVDKLNEAFHDLVRPFKWHYVVDLEDWPRHTLDAHHRRNLRRGAGELHVDAIHEPLLCAREWIELYANLVSRHHITGPAAFSPSSLAAQLAVPGATLFRARRGTDVVGITVWFAQAPVGYYHLGAYSNAGYQLRASYVLFAAAIEHFRASGLAALDLGGAPGLDDDEANGLARFKRGWSNSRRMTYLCGRILNPVAYQALSRALAVDETPYFPAYRAPRSA